MGKENELINAVKEGNVQFVRKVVYKYRRSNKKPSGKKQTINVADPEGFTALHHGALLGDVEIIMGIIEMEGDVNARDKKGMTPLHMAAWAGKDAAVKALVESRALPNLPSLAGETPLHLAAQHGYAACAKSLLESHSDGTFRNSQLETPLDLACQYGHTGVVKQLLQNEAVLASVTSPSTDPRYKSPLHLAAKSGHDDIVKLLLQAGVNVNECRAEGTALHLASLYGKTEVVKLLIQAGVNVGLKNKDGYMALDVVTQFTASRAGLEIKQLLREAAGERIVYARAVSDYHNLYDETCLNFKSGDSIAVLEQNEDGRWKGYVVNFENEKLGYFPAMAVHVLQSQSSSSNKTMSVSSMTSSSSVKSTSRAVQTPNGSPERKANAASPTSSAPVGIVPIGNFEVLTLAQGEQEFNQPPKQTAAGSLPPRMSSFKQKHASKSPIKSPRSGRAPSHKGPAPPPPIRSLSNENAPKYTVKEQAPPNLNHTPRRAYSERQPHKPRGQSPQRSISEEEQQHSRSKSINAQIAGQYPGRQKTPESTNQEFRNRTRSAGSAQHDFTRALKMAIGSRVENDKQTTSRQNSQSSNTSNPRNYAELDFSPGNSPVAKTPHNEDAITGNYASVYIDETDNDFNRQEMVVNNVQLNNNVNINVNNHNNNNNRIHNQHMNINGHHDNHDNQTRRRLYSNEDDENVQREYEEMGFRQHSTSVKSTTSRSGYEEMTSDFAPEPNFKSISPPELPRKGQGPQLPLKRSNTAPSNQRNSDNPSVFVPSQSTKSRDRSVYENQTIDVPWKRTMSSGSGGSLSPRSPNRLPNAFPVFLQTPTSPDGRTSPSDHRVSKTNEEVFDWLNELKLTCYFDAFKASGFDMISIQAITPEDLSYLEIHKTGHRKKLLSEIAKLSYSERLPNHKPRDVGSWLGLLNLRQYEPNFVEGGFDDMDFIKDLDKNDLEMIDIKKRGHQKKLSLAVQRLNDLELTAVLDIAVLESPIKRVPSFNSHNSQHCEPPALFQFPTTFKRNSSDDEEKYEENMSTASQHLPPPVVASKPGKSPIPVPSPKPKMNGDAPPTARKPAPAPSVKPKPKPAVKPPPTASASKRDSGEIQGSQEEIVKSSKSRDFFKQQEKKVLDKSPTNSLERRTSYSSSERRSSQSSAGSISPTGTIIKKKPAVPPPAPKPKPSVEVEPTPAPQPVAAKKVPPPAPPKRGDSMGIDNMTQSSPAFDAPHPPPSFHSEIVEKPIATVAPQQSFEPQKPESPEVCFSPPMPDFIPPPPPTESPESPPPFEDLPPPPVEILDEIPPQETNDDKNEDKEIEKAFGETDDILSDIMADLDDFSSQIDKMF